MRIFQRVVLLIKVLVMLSLGASAAWASNPLVGHGNGFSAAQGGAGSGFHAVFKSESDSGDEGQDDSGGDDQSGDEGDSQG